jgi:anti-sigma B factor antagonist
MVPAWLHHVIKGSSLLGQRDPPFRSVLRKDLRWQAPEPHGDSGREDGMAQAQENGAMEIQWMPNSLEAVGAVQGNALVIRLRGMATYKEAAVLQGCIRLIEQQLQALVVLDLAGVEFMDSATLGALITIKKLVRTRGGQLRLAALTGAAQELITVAGLSNFFSVYADVAQALI